MRTLVRNLAELYRFRDLLASIGGRTIKVRYKQSYLGIVWAVLEPIATMVVFNFIFGQMAKAPREGLPGPVFYLSGLIPWTFFKNSVAGGSTILASNANLIRKAYFPREILPLSSIFAALFDSGIAFVVYLGLSWCYGVPPGATVVLVVPVMLVAFLCALCVCLFLAPLNVYYRDIRHAVPLLLSLAMFVTVPIPLSAFPARWRPIVALNPMMAVIESFRAVTAFHRMPDLSLLLPAAGICFVLCLLGYVYFKRTEATFADIV